MLGDSRHCLHTESTNSIRKALEPMTAAKLHAGYTTKQWQSMYFDKGNTAVIEFKFVEPQYLWLELRILMTLKSGKIMMKS